MCFDSVGISSNKQCYIKRKSLATDDPTNIFKNIFGAKNINKNQIQKMDVALSHFSLVSFFVSMVLLRIPTAVEATTGIEGFKYQAGYG